jgi:hypothetical protein
MSAHRPSLTRAANAKGRDAVRTVANRWLRLAVWLGLLAPVLGHADEADNKTWSISPLLGIHSPRLTGLNRGEFQAPLPGRGLIVFPDTGESTNFDFTFKNSLPEINYGADVGIEFGLKLDPVNTLLLGTSVWQGGSTASIKAEFPFEGNLTPVGYERSARLSYFEYFIGWKRALLSESKRYNVHFRLTMHEIFDIDYKEDMVFGFQPPASDTFKRIIVMQSHATGALLFQPALGAEYFIRDWISLGADVGYMFSGKKVRLGNASLSTDIQADDNLNFRTPVQVGADGKLNYLANVNSYDDVTYRRLDLSFDGWRAQFSVNLYF